MPFCDADRWAMAAPAATASAMASLGASYGVGLGGRSGASVVRVGWRGCEGAACVSSCVMYGRVRSGMSFCCGKVVCRSFLGRRSLGVLRGSSSALAGVRTRRLLLASRYLMYAVSVSTESSVAVKALDGGDGGDGSALPASSKPVMTMQTFDANAQENGSVGLNPSPLKPAPEPVARSNGSGSEVGNSVSLNPPPRPTPPPNEISNSKPQQIQGSGAENGLMLKSSSRPVLQLNRSSPIRPQQGESSAIPSSGQVLEDVEKLRPSEAGPGSRGAGRRPVLTTQPGAWKAGDKIRTKAERERDAALAAEAAAAVAAERRAELGNSSDAQTGTPESEIPQTRRPRTQLNTLVKPIVRPAPGAARNGPVLKNVGASGPKLRDVGTGPRSQPSGSSTPPPTRAGAAGPPKPFAKATVKVGIILAFVIFTPVHCCSGNRIWYQLQS